MNGGGEKIQRVKGGLEDIQGLEIQGKKRVAGGGGRPKSTRLSTTPRKTGEKKNLNTEKISDLFLEQPRWWR